MIRRRTTRSCSAILLFALCLLASPLVERAWAQSPAPAAASSTQAPAAEAKPERRAASQAELDRYAEREQAGKPGKLDQFEGGRGGSIQATTVIIILLVVIVVVLIV
jgi:hypothetical protein